MENIRIKNNWGEELDVIVEGKENAPTTIVFVHGFGAGKDETANLFVEIADSLKNDFRIVRFDFSGYGKSQGKQEDSNYEKQAKELEKILAYVKENFSGGIYLYAHSMGCFVVSLLSLQGIEKTIFSGIPNSKTSFIVERFRKRIEGKGGVFNEKGITVYPRSSGEVQKVGSKFWQVLRNFDPVKAIGEYAKRTNLVIFKPKQDEVCGQEFMKEYRLIPGVKYEEIDGDHNFQRLTDRKILTKMIKRFLG